MSESKPIRKKTERYRRRSSRPTHFTCIPACTDDLKKSFNQIKKNILSDGYSGVDETLFISDRKIHITFGVCTLRSEIDRNKAAEVFKECSQEYVDRKLPIEVNVRGLKKFNDAKPTAVKVLFAGIQSENLQVLANKVLVAFRAAKLTNEDREVAVLHMTVMNVAYRLKSGVKKPGTFDATAILKKYGDFDFGTFQVDKILLAEIGSKDESGFYKALCTIQT